MTEPNGWPIFRLVTRLDLARLAHQHRLKQGRGSHRRQQRDRQKLAHARGAGMAGKPQRAECGRGGAGGKRDRPRTRAVTFSACTTATAFGSLWFSSHPGTSSMGKLLAISLLTTMAAAALFQPVLMGKPRQIDPGN